MPVIGFGRLGFGGRSMGEFDAWLVDQLTLAGCLVLGDPAPDVPAALALFQRSIGLPPSAVADDLTIHYLRQRRSLDPEAGHVVFQPVPPRVGSRFVIPELAA